MIVSFIAKQPFGDVKTHSATGDGGIRATLFRMLFFRTVLLAFVLPFCYKLIKITMHFRLQFANKGGVTMQLFLGAVPIILRLFSKARGCLLFSNYSGNKLPKPIVAAKPRPIRGQTTAAVSFSATIDMYTYRQLAIYR